MTGSLRVLASPASTVVDSNPYIDELYGSVRACHVHVEEFSRRKLLARPDVIHVHWPEFLVRWDRGVRIAVLDAAKVIALLTVARRRGARVVWTGHDLAPHESEHPVVERIYLRAFQRRTDHLISMSGAGIDALRARYPTIRDVPASVIPHGHYRDCYPPAPGQAEARRALGLPGDGQLLLSLGMIRPYKNFPALVGGLRADMASSLTLAVVGEVRDAQLKQELLSAAGDDPRIHLRLSRVPVAEIPLWHSAADVIVLPYTDGTALNSGAALLALSYNKPVVVRDSPTMRELQEAVGSQWVYCYTGTPADALVLARDVLAAPRPQECDLRSLDWPALGAATVAAYRAALGVRR